LYSKSAAEEYFMQSKRIILLGATGSIGSGTLDIVRSHPDLFSLAAVSAHRSEIKLNSIIREFSPSAAALTGDAGSAQCRMYHGASGLLDMIRETDADIVVNGIAGAAGLLPSWYSISSGKDLALANKETIVTAGSLIMAEASRLGRNILPVDSEHSALFHLLQKRNPQEIDQLILTASGGPFRERDPETFSAISLEEALRHPTWNMGGKITIDSATMANKGLEVIEAALLFDIQPSRIEVLIHPQSMVHSLIRTVDGSMYAQISKPDMRIPIQNALTYPELTACPFGRLNLADTQLSFSSPDRKRFPLLYLAFETAAAGGAYSIAYNAADEIAVEAFVKGLIPYTGIAELVEAALACDWKYTPSGIEEVVDIDHLVREKCNRLLEQSGGK
jgi:1-deoxy-D-xylulose-5-phosphate reductoisomerase